MEKGLFVSYGDTLLSFCYDNGLEILREIGIISLYFLTLFHMEPEVAKAALVFLGRANLNGNESEAMATVRAAIRSFIPKEDKEDEKPTDKDKK